MWRLFTVFALGLLQRAQSLEITGLSTDRSTANEQTKYSSIMGGGSLYVRGDFKNVDAGDISIKVGDKACPIIEFYTSDSYVECTIPAPPTQTSHSLEITASHLSETIEIQSSANRWLHYRHSRTSQVSFMNPPEGTPGDEIAFVGVWKTTDWSDFDDASVGNMKMEKYILSTGTSVPAWSHMNLTAVLGKNVHGDSDAEIRLINGYGLAHQRWTGRQHSLDGNPYHFRTLGRVDSISANSGSNLGGLDLEIKGAGFPSTTAGLRVEIDDNNCDVKHAEFGKILCTTGKQETSTTAPHEGGAGLKREVWFNKGWGTSFNDVIGVVTPDIVDYLPNPQIPTDQDTNILTRLTGFFKAPETGSYVFYIASDDHATVKLSTDSDPANAQAIITYEAASGYRAYFRDPTTQSDPQSLTAGALYYIEIQHRNGGGSGHFSLGVQTPNGSNHPNTLPVGQLLTIEPAEFRREVQTITVTGNGDGPTGGSFHMTYGTKTSNDIAWTGSEWPCSEIVTELRDSLKLPKDKMQCDMTRVDNNTLVYNITFDYDFTDERHYIIVDRQKILPAGFADAQTERIVGNTPVSGEFSLVFNGTQSNKYTVDKTIGWLSYKLNEDLPDFKNELFMHGTVSTSGSKYYFLFPPELSGNLLTLGESALTGGTIEGSNVTEPTVTLEQVVTPGSERFWWVVPSDFLRTSADSPQVRVWINNVLTLCRGNCAFTYTAPPTISSFSSDGTTLTIAGENFLENDVQVSVEVGHAACGITSISTTEIQCTLGQSVAGQHQPVVTDQAFGTYAIAAGVTNTIDTSLTITAVNPSTIGTKGGHYLTITGTGFWHSDEDTSVSYSVKIGESECEVKSISTTTIVCRTGAADATQSTVITVTVGTEAQTNDSLLTYDGTLEMTLSSVSPDYASTIYTTAIVISGQNFGTNAAELEVKIGDEQCLITAVTDTTINCSFLGSPKGTFDFVVYRDSLGYVWQQAYPVKFEIDSVSPTTGSVHGGAKLTINGKGFATEENTLLVQVGDTSTYCEIDSLPDANTIICVLPPLPSALSADIEYDVVVIGKLDEISDCAGTCKFTWASSASPSVTSITPDSAKAGETVTVAGTNFGGDSSNVQFMFDEVQATVTSVTATEVVATVPAVKGSSPALTLNFLDRGKAEMTATFTNSLKIGEIEPTSISQAGGIVKVNGSGFSATTTVTFGATACTLIDVEDDYLTCRVAEYSTDETAQLATVSDGSASETCADEALCGLSFLASKTSSISGLANHLDISGTFLGDLASITVKVTLGEHNCEISSKTSSSITCTPNAPPGDYTVNVHIDGYGYASGSTSYTVPFSVDPPSAVSSSFAGGQALSLTGKGLTATATVTVCGTPCEDVDANGASLSCKTPVLLTEHSVDTFQLAEKASYAENFATIADNESEKSKAFDGDTKTVYTATAGSAVWLGMDAGENMVFKLSTVEMMGGGGTRAHYKDLAGTEVQSSADGASWTTLYTYENVNDYWNKWVVTQDIRHRYFRIHHAEPSGNYKINELKFKGFFLHESSATSFDCDVVVSSGSTNSQTLTSAVTYSGSATPTVTNISPSRGTAAGGTAVTVTGTGFGTSATVTIDDVECTVSSVSDTSIQCTTGAKTVHVAPSLVVSTSNGRAATQGHEFTYAELWSDTNTWGGLAPPRAGETVWIPVGQTIVLDMPTPILNMILIEGALIVEDTAGITLDAHYIFIKGGKFLIGEEGNPYMNTFTLTMHGNRQTAPLPVYGNKVIANRNGVLEIHGKPRTPTWTELDTTAEAGTNVITLIEEVDWQVGEEIVIAPSSFEHTEAEVRTITAVTATTNSAGAAATQLTLNSPLEFQHYSAKEEYGDDFIEMRAEVGLLTRNVRIRGSDEGLEEEHGVHIMLFSPGDESLVGKIEYMELFNAGQAFTLGRYPLHFHMIGTVTQSYIRGNSIHHTFNRAVTVHGVHYLTIEHNVAYHTMGHTFFVEDGIETQNTLEHNLGVSTRASWSLLSTDQTPATFWITNFDNFFRNNHAAGSERYGFWFDPPEHPTGPSSTTDVCPMYVRLGEFDGNVAHSNGKYGLRIFHGHVPVENPCRQPLFDSTQKDWWNSNPAITASYTNFVAWKNKKSGAIIDELGDVRFTGFKVADSGGSGIELGWSHQAEPFNSCRVDDAMIVGKSANTGGDVTGAKGIVTPQRDGLLVNNVRFYNFDDTQWPIGDDSKSSHQNTRDHGARLHKLSNLKFTDSHKRFYWELPKTGYFEVTDASLTGTAGAYVAAYREHLLTPECIYDEATYNGIVCDGTTKIRRVMFKEQDPFELFNWVPLKVTRTSGEELQFDDVTTTDADGNTTTVQVPRYTSLAMEEATINGARTKSWGLPLVTGYSYNVHWGSAPIDWDKIVLESDTFESTEFVRVKMNFTSSRQHFEGLRGVVPAGTDTTAEDYTDPRVLPYVEDLLDTSPAGSFTWRNESEKYFEILLSGVPPNENQFGEISLTAHSCYGTHCEADKQIEETTELTTYSWSDATIWPGGQLPVAGQNVWVEPGWELILDIDTPILNTLEVNGRLVMDPTKSVTLNSNSIYVRAGSIVSGSPEAPTPDNISHQIILHGAVDSDFFTFTTSVDAGNKVLVNIGGLELYGSPKTAWAQLEQNALPGEDFLFVSSVNWTVGDTIAIAPSGFAMGEYESFTITAVDSVDASDSTWIEKNGKRTYGKDTTSLDTTITTTNTAADPTKTTKLTLSGSLSYYHAGTDVVVDGVKVDMRTEVVLLNRNVQIKGSDGWSCTILTSEKEDTSTVGGTVLRTGRTILNNVEIDNCGQFDSDKSALRFEKITNSTVSSTVESSVIKNSQTWAVYVDQVGNLQFKNNAIYNSRWRAVVIAKAEDSTFADNAIVGVIDRGYYETKEDKPGGFLTCYDEGGCTNVALTGNRVAGTPFAGYMSFPQACGESGAFSNNVAHSGDYGYILAEAKKSCLTASGMVAYTSHYGVAAFGVPQQIHLSGLKLADNHLGLSIKAGTFDKEAVFNYTDSLFVGKTHHTHCAGDCSSSDCDERIGFFTSYSEDFGLRITLNGLVKSPLYTAKGNGNTLGYGYFDKTTLANFRHDGTCTAKKQFGFKTNKGGADAQHPHYFSNFKFVSVATESKFYMNDPNPAWMFMDDCGEEMNCSGLHNVLIEVTDDTIISPNAGVILPNNPGIAKSDICELKSDYNAYVCDYSETQENFYEWLVIDSLDGDTLDRSIAPVNVTSHGVAFQSKLGGGFRNDLNFYMDHVWDGFYTGQKHLSRFPNIIYTGYYYNITLAGTHPGQLKFYLKATQNRDKAVVLAMKYQGPDNVQVWANGAKVPSIEYSPTNPRECTVNDPHGTNRWFHEDGVIQFVMRDETELIVKQVAALKVNMRIDMSVEDFFKDEGDRRFIDKLASVLGIPAYRIRIASARSGSVILEIIIDPDTALEDVEGSTEGVAADDEELAQVGETLTALAVSGDLEDELGMNILDMSVTVSDPETEDEDEDGSTTTSVALPDDDEEEFDEFIADYALALIIGGAVLILILVAVTLHCYCSRRKQLRSTPIPMNSPADSLKDPARDSTLFSKLGLSPGLQESFDLKVENLDSPELAAPAQP